VLLAMPVRGLMEVTQHALLVQPLVLRLLQLAQHPPPCALFVLLVSTYLAQLALFALLESIAPLED